MPGEAAVDTSNDKILVRNQAKYSSGCTEDTRLRTVQSDVQAIANSKCNRKDTSFIGIIFGVSKLCKSKGRFLLNRGRYIFKW